MSDTSINYDWTSSVKLSSTSKRKVKKNEGLLQTYISLNSHTLFQDIKVNHITEKIGSIIYDNAGFIEKKNLRGEKKLELDMTTLTVIIGLVTHIRKEE
ncbi:484_t:CDS:2 [Funneliformis geosporum]|nr:484_t:CDS:2 [Funneliformis geosporum]